MIQFSKPTLGLEETQAVSRVLSSGWLAAGLETSLFEKEFADYVGVKYAIFTNSCTSALKMAYKWAIYDKDDAVIHPIMYYPENTFCATYAAFQEMDFGSMIIPYKNKNEAHIVEDDDIVVNVHYGGIKDETPCLIEDSAHRIEPNDPLVGKIRCYSFYVTKNMTTGSGGMFVTNDKEIYEKARLYWQDGISSTTYQRKRGQGWNYKVLAMAGGYDGNDIAAAIGREQLKKLPKFTKKRNRIIKRYNKAFKSDWQGNHLMPYFVKSEKEVGEFIKFMRENGINCGYHYPHTGWLGVSLPVYPLLTKKEQDYIIDRIKLWKITH
jgi:dTDP-4-amino-4,6-dideoxygalactose transaminase